MRVFSRDDLRLPLLITGVAGVAGYNALRYFRKRFPGQVIGIRQEKNWPLHAPDIEPCNAENRAKLQQLFDRYRFGSVLNCAGNCALKSCELDPALAWRTNVEGVRNLLGIIDGTKTRLVHLSIDLVFSGAREGNHAEEDFTDPVTEYGHSMVAAERLILLAEPYACILRISLPMGISHSGHAGAIDWIQWRFKNLRPATLYYDEVRTPSYTDCMNQLFEEVLCHPLQGIYHAGGPRCLSLYEIAQIVNVVGGYDPELLHGCTRDQAGPIPPRAGNVTLDSSKLTCALGYQPLDPWPLDDSFVPSGRDWHLKNPSAMRGSAGLLAKMLYRNRSRNHRKRESHGISQV